MQGSRTILAEWCVQASIFDLSATKEDCFELLEVKHTVASSIVLGDHIMNFLTINLFAKLLHSQANIFFGDFARRIRVELVEDCLEAGLSQEVLNVNRSSQELTVVDLFIVMVVHLIDHF